jgi:hypothetical protein
MSEDEAAPDELLEQIHAFLEAQDPLGRDRATLEDFLILEHLQVAVRAARVKGYTVDLLVLVLRALFPGGPEGR